ncbi:hypothetical protein FJZ31_00025 [Candidatus Poribacteria bacterium]|nr:hypothetical protein [Candidatus Poribacteria bacterium]
MVSTLSPMVISIVALVATVVIGLLIYDWAKKSVSQGKRQSTDASNMAKSTLESVQKLKGELTETIQHVDNISNLQKETLPLAQNAENKAHEALNAIEELKQKIDRIANQFDQFQNTRFQTDIKRVFDSIEEIKIKIETVSQLSELKIASIEDLIKKIADFVGFNIVPTPVDILGAEVGQPLIKAGLDTVEKIANAEIITIARILPEFSFNKVMEIIQQANDFSSKP